MFISLAEIMGEARPHFGVCMRFAGKQEMTPYAYLGRILQS